MNYKNVNKLVRLGVTFGLLFWQLATPIGQAAFMQVKEPSSTSISSDSEDELRSQKQESTDNKELVSENGNVKISVKNESGFEPDALIKATLNSESKARDKQKNYTQDIEKMSLELRKQGRSISDVDLVSIECSTKQLSDITTTLTFINGLTLAGLEKNKQNIRVGVVLPDGQVQIVTPVTEQGEDGHIRNLTFTGQIGERLIIVSTNSLMEEQSVSLAQYGTLLIDGSVVVSKQGVKNYSKSITVNILKPKLSSIESSLASKDFEIVKKIDNLYTWDEHFDVLDFVSDDYEVLKAEFQSATDAEPTLKEMLFGHYRVVTARPEQNKIRAIKSNTINIYIRSTKPLGLKPMPISSSIIQPRGFRSYRAARNMQAENSHSELEHHKRIDYLGDQKDNPDTTVDDKERGHDTSDLYRLYLDMTGKKQPLDVLVVVDRSGSMQEGIGSVQKYRYYAQRWDNYYGRWIYHGTFDYPSYQGEYFDRDQIRYQYRGTVSISDGIRRDDAVKNSLLGVNGLLQRFVNINPENKLSVIGFQGSVDYPAGKWYPNQSQRGGFYQPNLHSSRDADTLKGWSTNSLLDSHTLTALHNNGTNYHAALLKANEMLNEVKDDGRRKIMIFISDGVPTFYFGEDGYRSGNGSSNDSNNVTQSQVGSKLAIDEFKDRHPNLSIYSLGVSKDINSDTSSSSPVVLKYLSGDNYYYSITDTVELEKTANKIVEDSKIFNLIISDSLSQYVDYYEQKPDILVTRISKSTKKVQTLFKNGQITNEGKYIVENVLFTPKTDIQSKGKVTLTFKPDYKVDDEYTYTLSFNVKASDKAYESYKDMQGKYSVNGENDTDYSGNQTSSGKGGLPSNSDASINYMADSRQQKLPYPHPVIQVKTIPVSFTKVDASDTSKKLDGVMFELRMADKKNCLGKRNNRIRWKSNF